MSLWSNLDASNSAPKSAATGGYGITANTQGTLYGNTKTSHFVQGMGLGVFGVDPTEQRLSTGGVSNAANTNSPVGANTISTHAGWVLRKQGMGPILTITANSGAVSANGTLTFGGGNKGMSNTAARQVGGVNNPLIDAVATVAVNTAQHITSITVNAGGFYANTPTVMQTAVAGNGAFTITMGGRANRSTGEALVAMGSMRGDGNDDAVFTSS